MQNCLLCMSNIDCQQCETDYVYDGTKCISTIISPLSIYQHYFSQVNISIRANQSILNPPDRSFSSNIKTTCGGYSVFGGFQQPDVYFNLTMFFHNQVLLRFTVIAIDDWDLNNILQVDIDGTIYNLISRNKYDNMNIDKQCGSQTQNDNIYNIYLLLNHYRPTLVLSFKFSNPSIRQNYGVFNVSLDYYYCGPKFQCATCDPSGTQCLTCSDPTRQISNNCLCPQGGNIQSQLCPDCNQMGPLSQVYCILLTYCLQAIDNYIPFCLNDCATGYIMNQLLNQCEKNSPSRLDQFPVMLFGQYLNTLTFTNTPNWIYVVDVFQNLVSAPIGSCGQQNLIGGVGFQGGIYLNLYNLPPYRRIKIKFRIIIIDIQEDLTIMSYLNGDEYYYPYELLVYSSGSFQYGIVLQSSNTQFLVSSFGIYDITISYQPCADEIRCATCDDNGCLTCSVPARIQSPLCLCPTYEYMNYADCPTCPYKCQGNLCNLYGCIVCADSRRGDPPDCLCPTYEIYGVSSCPLCQQYCLHCSDNMCFECLPGYYPFGEFCYLCPYQCSTCLFNGCLTCSDPQRGPAPFCRCPSYEIIGLKQCPICQQNCQICDQTGCLICQFPRTLPLCDCPANYYEKDYNCIQCDNQCLTCNSYSCLTCPRSDLTLPYCICPQGYQNVNDECTLQNEIIKSYGYFNQKLTQIIIGFDQQFNHIGLDNSNILIQENCIIINNAKGLCQIFDQKIIYQFDDSIIINLGDEIVLNSQIINFLNIGQFTINQIFVALNFNIDYRPYFDIDYPNLILTCQQYLIRISNIIYVGNQNYQIQGTGNGVQIQQQYNQILITSLIEGQVIINIKITNFVGYSLTKSIEIQSNQDLQLDFDILPNLGQLSRHFDLVIQISQIILHSCNQNFKNTPISKIININFSNLYIAQFKTQDQQIKLNIDVGSLSIGQIYSLNITVTYQQYTKSQITNYTINQIKPFFSILGGNRMVYINNRLNVSAIIVDPDTSGLICFWTCINLVDQQDCGFNFTYQMYQIIEKYQLALYQSYLFSYNCLGIVVQAIYHVVDIDEDQLFMFFPAFYSTYDLNKLYPVEYMAFNETKNNLLKPIILDNIYIKVIQNFTILYQELQINSYGFQNLLYAEGFLIIQAQINSMISSINVKLKNLSLTQELIISPFSGVCAVSQITLSYTNFSRTNSPYLFRYLAIINDKFSLLLSDWSVYETQKFYLPQGIQSKNYTYQLIGQIIDKFGYLYNISGKVQVFPSQNQSFIEQLLLNFQASYFYFQKLLYLGSQYLQIQQDGCQNNCSGNGLCKNQQCICQVQYYLLDCSANQTQYDNLNQNIKKLLYDLIDNNMVDNTFISLLLSLLDNYYVQMEIEKDYVISLVEYVIYNMESLINQQVIRQNNIDEFIQILNNPQSLLNKLQLDQLLANFIQLVDIQLVNIIIILKGIVLGGQQIQNSSLQNNLSLKLINIAKLYSYYQGSQLFIDQSPYKLNLNNFKIFTYRVSSNYSQIFFNQPVLMQNQISFLEDQKILQLQNDSIVSQVIFKTNPYIFDENYPYPTQQNQIASVQVYDYNGQLYRSFQPLTIQLVAGNQTTGSDIVCIAQQNGKWIAKLCQTIKITGSNATSCQCDTLDQQSVVDDVNNLYGNSKIYALQNYESILWFQFYTSILTYLLTFFGICSITFGYIGYKLDVLEYQLNQQKIYQQNLQQEIEQQQTLNYDSEEEAILIRFDLMRSKHRDLKKEIIVGFKKLHPFIRIYSQFLVEEPRPARYIIYFLKQCILLSITSIFGKGFSVVQNVFLGIMSMIFITPLEKLLMYGFNQKSPRKIKIILTSFIVIIYLSCWYICIAVSVTVDTHESNQWTLIFFISFMINQLIVEGFTIVLKIIIAPYLSAILFNGGFMARAIYLYLSDVHALQIVKDLNMLNTIQF